MASNIYMKMDPPPDADKTYPPGVTDDTCWLATAANILAGAGYGNGNTVQARANDIYQQLINHFGYAGGWADTAITWWLNSAHNTWTNNRYTNVTVYGNKYATPWSEPNGARFIGNELRKCQFVGLSISWSGINQGHAITCWGDNEGSGTLTNNPTSVRVADSDRDNGGDVQEYNYDAYTNPNPGGPNNGNGWYFNYSGNHPFIKHIVTLCPTDDPSDNKLTQKVVGSVQIHQAQEKAATDLHYEVGTDVDILSYKTAVDWETTNRPSIIESQPRRKLTVDWNFSDKPVPYCNTVTITAEFVLPYWNSIAFNDVRFTYPDTGATLLRGLRWEMKTRFLEKAEFIRNVTGGYVIGSFDVINPKLPSKMGVVAKYRFLHEYSYNQSPEEHLFMLSGERGYLATNLRFGHSYGYLPTESLWKFDKWMTEMPEWVGKLSRKPTKLLIDWKNRLPYPQGETVYRRIPEIETEAKFVVKVAKNLDEAMKLLEEGYDFVGQFEKVMLFRKRI